jgi:hypothetical protein
VKKTRGLRRAAEAEKMCDGDRLVAKNASFAAISAIACFAVDFYCARRDSRPRQKG